MNEPGIARSLLTLSFAAVALLACGGSTSTTSSSGNGATNSTATTCADLSASASKELTTFLEGHRACTRASDCVSIGFGASCFDACSRAMRSDAAADYKAAQQKVDAAQCMQFTAQGCKVTVPPCAPPNAATCTNGMCTE